MSKENFSTYELSENIKRALTDLNYHIPTEVQQKVIPLALEQKDLVVKSQTGSGKTASFGIPICELVDWEENKPQALILTPTRELAAQVKDDMTNIGRFKRVKAVAVYGKSPVKLQKLELKQKTHVVVGTPGRVLDHIEKGTLSLDHIKYLVIDEADEMFNMGFIDQVEAIIRELPKKRVTSIYSATLPNDVQHLRHKYMNDPIEIEVVGTGVATSDIDHSLIKVTEDQKLSLFKDLTIVENPDSCLVFCGTKEKVDHLNDELTNLNYSCEKIHGGLDQDERFSVMNDFKLGKFRYLIATDVAARGIDIESISLVINFDFPMEKQSYVHRTGRTGRAGNTGKAITFVTKYESKFISEIERYLGFTIPVVDPPTYTEVAKQKKAFEEKMNAHVLLKKERNATLNKNIMKLYFNGGKKKKLRPVDFVGTITNIPNITADDIGIITIKENVTYVDILNGKGSIVLQEMKEKTIKGKQLKVHLANK